MRAILLTSFMTAFFCALIAGGVDVVTDALTVSQVMTLGAMSGGVGSFFAQIVVRRGV